MIRFGFAGLLILIGLLLLVQVFVEWQSISFSYAVRFVVPSIAYLFVGLSVLFRLDQLAHERFIRRPDCGIRVRWLLTRVANDKKLHVIANLRSATIQTFLRSVRSATVCYSPVYQGGYAGRRHPPRREIVLALSPLCLRSAAAAHELLHLTRDVLGRMALDAKLTVPEVLVEEVHVWLLTVRYRPIQGLIELFLQFFVFLGLPAAALYRIYSVLTMGDAAW